MLFVLSTGNKVLANSLDLCFKDVRFKDVEILSFGFCLVNSVSDAYLPVDHSLVYSHPKMLPLFFNIILSLV